MGSLTSGWATNAEPAPLSIEEELKMEQPRLGRISGSAVPVLERRSSQRSEERMGMLLKVAEKQQEDDIPNLARRSTGPPSLSRKSPAIKVHIRGHRGSTVVLETESLTPRAKEAEEFGDEEEDEQMLGMGKDKWWKKLSSSALNELEREPAEDASGPSSYVPQFDLTGSNPYAKGDEA